MINLTIPLYPYMPSGNVYPWEAPFYTEDIASYERNDARLFYISLGSETGTRLIGPSFFAEGKPCLPDISLESIINRPARIVSIPKNINEEISLKDVNTALDSMAPFTKGDALIITTGWGNSKRWKEMKEEYVTGTPYFSLEAAVRVADFLEEHQSDLMLTDCLYLDGFQDQTNVMEWRSANNWVRLPHPSEHAKAFIRNYSKQDYLSAWKSTQALVKKHWVVLGLSGCDQINSDRLRVHLLPLFIDDVGQSPCCVVAEPF